MLLLPNPDSAISMTQPVVVVCCNSPSVTMTDELWAPRCHSAHHCCTVPLFACSCLRCYCSLYNSCRSPSTSLINELFSPKGLPLTVFCLSLHSRGNPRKTLLCVKSPGGRPFLRFWNRRAWQRRGHSILPILTFNLTITECAYACLPALYRKPRPHDSLSVGANHFRERGVVPNKLTTECINMLNIVLFTLNYISPLNWVFVIFLFEGYFVYLAALEKCWM
jgi:hypothetical protein